MFSRIKFAEKQRTIQQIQTIYNKKKNRRGTHVSILNVEHLSHGFGDRAIFQDVSIRLLKGEHIGLIGANGEGNRRL